MRKTFSKQHHPRPTNDSLLTFNVTHNSPYFDNDSNQYANPKPNILFPIPEPCQHPSPLQHALILQSTGLHALTLILNPHAIVLPPVKLIEHDNLEDITLVIDPVEGVVHKVVQHLRGEEEATYRLLEAVAKVIIISAARRMGIRLEIRTMGHSASSRSKNSHMT